MSSLPEVACIIPTWNGVHLLEACLTKLKESTTEVQLCVVDNGSDDGTSAWLRHAHPEALIIQNQTNRGFAAATNQGILATQTPWVALLNNDAMPNASWLSELLRCGEADPGIGAVASRMMFRNHRNMVSSAGIRMDRSAAAWDLWLGGTSWPSNPIEVFGASGGACLLRREMLEDIGLLDGQFFAYLEDVDLAWRARLRGWKTVLAPAAVVYHALSSTSREGSTFKRYRLASNKWRVILRNYPMPQLLENFPTIAAYDVLSIANSLRLGDSAPLHGRLDAWRDWPTLARERCSIQAQRTATWSDISRAMSPLESPLKLRRRAKLVASLAAHSDVDNDPPA